jgi:hypothetical protein
MAKKTKAAKKPKFDTSFNFGAKQEMRLAAARSHAKVICFESTRGGKMVVEGSANLRTNSNIEQITLIADPDLHDWHAAWIDGLVAKHEGENDEGERE